MRKFLILPLILFSLIFYGCSNMEQPKSVKLDFSDLASYLYKDAAASGNEISSYTLVVELSGDYSEKKSEAISTLSKDYNGLVVFSDLDVNQKINIYAHVDYDSLILYEGRVEDYTILQGENEVPLVLKKNTSAYSSLSLSLDDFVKTFIDSLNADSTEKYKLTAELSGDYSASKSYEITKSTDPDSVVFDFDGYYSGKKVTVTVHLDDSNSVAIYYVKSDEYTLNSGANSLVLKPVKTAALKASVKVDLSEFVASLKNGLTSASSSNVYALTAEISGAFEDSKTQKISTSDTDSDGIFLFENGVYGYAGDNFTVKVHLDYESGSGSTTLYEGSTENFVVVSGVNSVTVALVQKTGTGETSITSIKAPVLTGECSGSNITDPEFFSGGVFFLNSNPTDTESGVKIDSSDLKLKIKADNAYCTWTLNSKSMSPKIEVDGTSMVSTVEIELASNSNLIIGNNIVTCLVSDGTEYKSSSFTFTIK